VSTAPAVSDTPLLDEQAPIEQEQKLLTHLAHNQTRLNAAQHALHDHDTLPDTGSLSADALYALTDALAHSVPSHPPTLQDLAQHASHARHYLDADFWREVDTSISQHLKALVAFARRRRAGDYQTDPYGMDPELVELMRPLFRFLYYRWWRVRARGLEHVPAQGGALLVSNHSGVLPWDGAMITTAVMEEHPSPRLVRNLFLTWFNEVPFLAPLFAALGQVVGVPDNAVHLLEEGHLVCTFPEGEKGVSKPFEQRYRLRRFGRNGFVKVALRTGAPLVPVAVVGAEEIYPLISRGKGIARLLGFPFFPITPFFPWLGPLGAIPLPSRWSITFCPPIPTAEYGPAAADDPLVVFALSEQVRSIIQQTINEQLAARQSIFL
jgi:1-acyl-sn-glycerol-3-phosphate acyltransferase